MTSETGVGSRGGARAALTLARRILSIHATQPATAIWRMVEARVTLENLVGAGDGLDVGCGDGTLATILFADISEVRWKGIDLDERDVSLARKVGVYQEVHLAPADRIPEGDASFDLVFSNSALEHMTPLPAVLGEVARVLRPGGRFVLTVPVIEFRRNLLWYRVLRRLGLSELARRYVEHLDRRLAHTNYLSGDGWCRVLSEANLQVVRKVPYLSRRALACWETLANLTGGAAYLAAGGRRSPRQIQHALGIELGARPWVGKLMFFLLLPVILFIGLERSPNCFSAVYIETVRQG